MKPVIMKRIVYLLIFLTSYNSYAQENVNQKNIDSIVNDINKQKLQIQKTITSDSTVDKYDFVDTYYADSNGNLIVFTSETSGKIKFGKMLLFSENKYYFHENKLIKLEMKRTIPGYNPNFTEYYFFKDIKYPKKEKRFRSYIAGKEKSILETFEN